MGIRDLGYKPYDGVLLPHRTRYRVLVRRGLALAWGSGLVKTTMILGAFPMVICGAIMYFKLKAMQFISAAAASASAGAQVALSDPGDLSFTCIYWCQLWFAFVVSLLVAAPAVAEDVRTGAFQFYFSRPVSRAHYLVGKVAPPLLLVAIISLGPALLLALLRVALSGSGDEALHGLGWVLKTLAYGPVYALVLVLPPAALSALGRRAGGIQGIWAAAFFLSWLLGEGIAAGADVPYLALLSLPTDLRLVGQAIYGLEPAYAVPWVLPAGVLAFVVGGSALVLYRRLQRVEVFS